jgi:hypothetical protein
MMHRIYWNIMLSASCKMSSIILISRLIPYADETTDDRQYGFGSNRSTTNQNLHTHTHKYIYLHTHTHIQIYQIQEKKWEYNGTVHQLFVDLKKAYDSLRTEALYNVLTESGIPRKLKKKVKQSLYTP